MNATTNKLSGPDLVRGVALPDAADGAMLLWHAHGEPVLLAIGGIFPHYGAPLADGLLAGDTVRYPWHHACLSLRTGAALRALALDPIFRWRAGQRDGSVHVCEKPTVSVTTGTFESGGNPGWCCKRRPAETPR